MCVNSNHGHLEYTSANSVDPDQSETQKNSDLIRV